MTWVWREVFWEEEVKKERWRVDSSVWRAVFWNFNIQPSGSTGGGGRGGLNGVGKDFGGKVK